MSRLSQIPVRVEVVDAPPGGPADGGLGGGVVAVLHEIATLLERLHSHNESGAVDLGTMPLSPEDYACLRSVLGDGEVDATVHAEGPSRVCETGVHGVWWTQHRDADERLLAELIEITTVPRILQTAEADIASGLERIRNRLRDAHDREHSQGGSEHDA